MKWPVPRPGPLPGTKPRFPQEAHGLGLNNQGKRVGLDINNFQLNQKLDSKELSITLGLSLLVGTFKQSL